MATNKEQLTVTHVPPPTVSGAAAAVGATAPPAPATTIVVTDSMLHQIEDFIQRLSRRVLTLPRPALDPTQEAFVAAFNRLAAAMGLSEFTQAPLPLQRDGAILTFPVFPTETTSLRVFAESGVTDYGVKDLYDGRLTIARAERVGRVEFRDKTGTVIGITAGA
jgi:hypothetical protein